MRPDGSDELGDVPLEHLQRLVGAGDERADGVLEQHALPDLHGLGSPSGPDPRPGHRRAVAAPAVDENGRVQLGRDVTVVGVVTTESLDELRRERRVVLGAHEPDVTGGLGDLVQHRRCVGPLRRDGGEVVGAQDCDLLEVHRMVGRTLGPVLHLDTFVDEPGSDVVGGRALARPGQSLDEDSPPHVTCPLGRRSRPRAGRDA
ncbi:hypothetical protein GCM10009721_14790 [Terrabacter tumescens]|uniref:Uncharacterized protein n=1 Tax=Terrabacter tumescens TaxID=60443 RepID=A0ABQ2HUQ8_9MICO|nr:hypothetical protein [Terrabacter tumescens]GGM90387.1 hypothetical protein GCM10009721_14790 [Terrabacter tumescens]